MWHSLCHFYPCSSGAYLSLAWPIRKDPLCATAPMYHCILCATPGAYITLHSLSYKHIYIYLCTSPGKNSTRRCNSLGGMGWRLLWWWVCCRLHAARIILLFTVMQCNLEGGLCQIANCQLPCIVVLAQNFPTFPLFLPLSRYKNLGLESQFDFLLSHSTYTPKTLGAYLCILPWEYH